MAAKFDEFDTGGEAHTNNEIDVDIIDASAEALFREAENDHQGCNGRFYDPQAARRLYARAAAKGCAKPALNLSRMHQADAFKFCNKDKQLQYIEMLFVKAARLGHPEGLLQLCDYFRRTPGKESESKADHFLELAAKYGCPESMVHMGKKCLESNRIWEGKNYLYRALRKGRPDAAVVLARHLYEKEYNPRGMVDLLRRGASCGSVQCIRKLMLIYERGLYGQPRDLAYARKFQKLLDELRHRGAGMPIANFDQRFPPQAGDEDLFRLRLFLSSNMPMQCRDA